MLSGSSNIAKGRRCQRHTSVSELEYWADTYLTLHWRLREFSLKTGKMDFVAYASRCQWATMRLDELEVIDTDLAIKGVPINTVDDVTFRDTLSIM